MKYLLIGAGNRKNKMIFPNNNEDFGDLVRLDINPDCNPDVLWDLEKLPLPFKDNEFDEIHAYEVLEHVGQQGDFKFFFAQFSEFWRILKPGGFFCATVPTWDSMWAWGDPSHKRIINDGTLVFLSQKEYERQVGKNPMTDFRYLYSADFDLFFMKQESGHLIFILQAVKNGQTCNA
jgi:SAM-dependent methyltransferase